MQRPALESLPQEVLLSIYSFLPIHSNSIRPLSALVPLLATSRHLHDSVVALLNSQVSIHHHQHAHAFLAALHHQPSLATQVTSIAIDTRSSSTASHPEHQPAWTQDELRGLLNLLLNLQRVSIAGVESARSLEAVLAELERADSPSSLASYSKADTFSSSAQVQFRNTVTMLHLDCETRSSGQGLGQQHDESSSAAADRTTSTTSTTTDPFHATYSEGSTSSMLSACSRFTGLSDLHIMHLPNEGLFLSALEVPSGLQRLSLSHSTLAGPVLRALLVYNSSTLEHLVLDNCKFDRQALVDGLAAAGSRLKSLKIISPTPVLLPQARNTSNSSLVPSAGVSSPSRSPLSSPSLASRAPPSPDFTLPLHHIDILDLVLPHTPFLQHLAFSGPLLSDPTTLPSSLATLAISACPSLTPRQLLPALDSTSRLRRLSINALRPLGPDLVEEEHELDGVEELWSAAVNREVLLEGNVFEKVKGRMGWALDVAAELNEVEKSSRSEARPRRFKRAGAGLR